ncbi:MAG TPA: hypothetical protein VH419_17105 [Nocardioidaceae bacterium]|jgi:hypothetical protein
MDRPRDPDLDRQLQFLRALLEDNASIDGDVLEISENTWAIHGDIAVDGEVLMAEFATYEEARYVLDQVRGTTLPTSEPESPDRQEGAS